MSGIITFIIHKKLLKFRPHEAVIRQPLIDGNHWTAWAQAIYIFTCRRIRECTFALSSCYFRVAAFRLCSYVRGFPRSGVPLYPRIHRVWGWVGPGVNLDIMEKRKFFCSYQEPSPDSSPYVLMLWYLINYAHWLFSLFITIIFTTYITCITLH
jgi:hypothetical protein